MTFSETGILMSVVGFIGVLGTLVVLSYGYNRNAKYEAKLAQERRQKQFEQIGRAYKA